MTVRAIIDKYPNCCYFAFPGLATTPGLQTFLERVARVTDVSIEQIRSRDKTEYTSLARHIFCWYAIRGGYRHDEVAKSIGRHRTSASHSEKLIKNLIAIGDRQVLNIINRLTT
jgi:chromosomal replication initiation ATPase DnaA